MSQEARSVEDVRSSHVSGRCLPLTPEVVSALQVLLSGIEVLQVMDLPAEAFLTVRQVSDALDDLVAAIARERATKRANGMGISVGSQAWPR